MSTYILGINISHHPSLALLRDGELVYYLEDDRWNRKKEQQWKVNDIIQSLVDVGKVTKHIDHVIFASFGKDQKYKGFKKHVYPLSVTISSGLV